MIQKLILALFALTLSATATPVETPQALSRRGFSFGSVNTVLKKQFSKLSKVQKTHRPNLIRQDGIRKLIPKAPAPRRVKGNHASKGPSRQQRKASKGPGVFNAEPKGPVSQQGKLDIEPKGPVSQQGKSDLEPIAPVSQQGKSDRAAKGLVRQQGKLDLAPNGPDGARG